MVDRDDTRWTIHDGRRTTPGVWHKLPTGRGVTIHDATIRYVSRYKPQDTVYDTIHKTRYTTTAKAPQQRPGPIK